MMLLDLAFHIPLPLLPGRCCILVLKPEDTHAVQGTMGKEIDAPFPMFPGRGKSNRIYSGKNERTDSLRKHFLTVVSHDSA
jgi:hypothetical protein